MAFGIKNNAFSYLLLIYANQVLGLPGYPASIGLICRHCLNNEKLRLINPEVSLDRNPIATILGNEIAVHASCHMIRIRRFRL